MSSEKPRRSARRAEPKPQNNSPENDESLEKRRQRNRKAQRLFRLRRQAAHANYEKNLIHMEGALEQMASTFLDFTNGILQSPLISRDPALISKLRTATDSILFLCQGTNNNNELDDNSDNSQTTIKAVDPSSSPDNAAIQQNFHGNGQLPQATAVDDMYLDFNAFNQPRPAPQPGSGTSAVRYNNQFSGWHSPQIRNIFGNGFMSLPPIDFADCADTDSMLKMYPADDSLSMIVTRASLQNAYDAILSDTQASTPMVDRIFGFPLKFRSREEILMVLRWYLRPSSPEVVRLATAEFDDYLVAQYYHGIVTAQYRAVEGVFRGDIVTPPEKGSPPPAQSRILNAYQIEQWLLACGLRYIDFDTMALMDLKPTGLLLNTKPPDDPDVLLATLRALQQENSIGHPRPILLQCVFVRETGGPIHSTQPGVCSVTMGSVQPPTKPCHNCRRQRLRCDRSYPHCNKCAASGKECLGYGKLFRWTGAIASRGKLAGRTSSAPVNAGDAEDADAGTDGDEASQAGAVSPIVRSRRNSPHAVALNGSFSRRSSTDAEALQVISISQPASPSAKLSSPWVLVDPLFQGLDPAHRFYLNYFTSRVCKDLVSNDGPECNPFRSLIPLTRAHPLLQHIIVAASAAHMSNLIRMGLPYPDGGFIPANRDAASTRALNDALVAKHTALKLMSTAIQNLDSINGDVVLAASLFFINVELIESGKHGWRAHLEGAAKIMSFLQLTKAWDSSLRDYLLSDCFIYFILASAFMPARYAASLNFESSQIPFVLGKTVANSYLCCPPELMEILHEASQLSNSVMADESKEATTMAALELIDRAQAYDIYAWARDTARALDLATDVMQSRMHAGASHRLAACIYILQAIPSAGERLGPEFAAFLTDDLLAHLNMMPVDDPNFKATTWPTFIIGAETRDPVRQKFIMERLRIMTTVCPWGFIHTAMETLQVIWNLAAEERGSKSWVQTLKDPEMNFLIV